MSNAILKIQIASIFTIIMLDEIGYLKVRK